MCIHDAAQLTYASKPCRNNLYYQLATVYMYTVKVTHNHCSKRWRLRSNSLKHHALDLDEKPCEVKESLKTEDIHSAQRTRLHVHKAM